jgi:cleavage stimulation factor subunit 3
MSVSLDTNSNAFPAIQTSEMNSVNSPIKSDDETILPPTPVLSQFESWLADLEKNPDQPEQWRRFIDMAENTGDPAKIRTAYDALLKQYPNTVREREYNHKVRLSLTIFSTSLRPRLPTSTIS